MNKRIHVAKYEKQRKVQAAIDEFGIDNVEVIVLCEGLTREGAHQIEQKFMDYYDVYNPEKGYNTLRVRKNENSEEARRKNRESSLKFYKEHPEMKISISEKRKAFFKENPEKRQELANTLKEYYYSNPEKIEALRAKNKCYPVICLETGIVYPSASNCKKKMHLSATSHIMEVCKGLRHHCEGYSFAFT